MPLDVSMMTGGEGMRPVVGWESEKPVPDHVFNDYLSSRKGRLYYEDLDLAQFFYGDREGQGLGRTLPSPLEIVYLPKIREKILRLHKIFERAIDEVGYEGRFIYSYASKANAAEEVVRTALRAGVQYEISSTMDVEIIRLMKAAGHLPSDRMIICNGFKAAGTHYAENIIRLRGEHENVIPVIEDLSELPPLLESGLAFDVGLRQKCYGPHEDRTEMERANSRFGMKLEDILTAAERVSSSAHLRLKLYHAMVGSQILEEEAFLKWLKPPIEIYAQLRQKHSHLSIFDFGGGMPVPMTLDFGFDYASFVRAFLETIQSVCRMYDVPVPDVMGEMGRFTVAEHGAHLFKVLTTKDNGSQLPWYLIDGSIMSSFPDSWALGEHFIVLPLNHLDKPFRRVQLGGITCDSDDIYPPKSSQAPLYLPEHAEDLYVGFFGIGAYQEMLGGVGGSKHCVIPEANELIIDRSEDGTYQFQLVEGQGPDKVLRNLGYRSAVGSG
jgi:arginine decarboxylase